MVRILAFTDPHGEIAAAEAILRLARSEHPDVIVCSGDFSYFGGRCTEFLDALSGLGRKVYFIPGNHETEDVARDVEARFPYMENVAFRAVDAGKLLLAGLPGSMEFWPGGKADPHAVDQAGALWGGLDRSKPFVLLSHYPPWKSAISGLSHPSADSGGSMTVRKIAEALVPDLLIAGHYHQDFGKSDQLGRTRLVNPGPQGRILEL